ncbi:hypothetical protein B0H13DRAFT_2437772 [Mycena leptocephala]|nr:hypothetical protein B0H13DRAFT_2437772 [Mycena leptocephala]
MPPPPTRPATISELATAAAETSSSNSNGDLKNLLRRAEGYRRTGGVYMARTTGGSSGVATSTDIGLDLERVFIEYARAATLIVETVPAHREYLFRENAVALRTVPAYSTGLNAEQRANLKASPMLLWRGRRLRRCLPVSLGRSSSSGTGAAPVTLPVSFAGASSGSGGGDGGGGGAGGAGRGGGAYGAYPSIAGVSFPQPHRSASLQAPSAGSYADGGKEGSPTSYTSTYATPSGAASYSSYTSTTNLPSSYTSTSTAPSSYTSPTPSNYTSASASAHNTPAPGPMPLRPPFANSAEWEWGESTDEERPHARISFPTTGTGTGMPAPNPQGHGQYGGGGGYGGW